MIKTHTHTSMCFKVNADQLPFNGYKDEEVLEARCTTAVTGANDTGSGT